MKVPVKNSKTYLCVWAVLMAVCLGFATVFATACSKNEGSAENSGAVVSLAQIEDESSGASSASQATVVEAVHDPDPEIDAKVQAKLGEMTTEQKVAQLFVAFPESLCSDGSTLTYVDDDVRKNLAENPVGGVILLGDNLVDEEQTRALLADLQSAAQENTDLPLLLCVDEEGGEVSRIGGNDAFTQKDAGPVRAIGDTGNVEAAQDAAKMMGDYLFNLGFNVDFAPVADVDTPEASTMQDRSFGEDSALVANMVVAQIKGFAQSGMLCSAKHFPGIGSAIGDSHDESITIEKDHDQLLAKDLVPFKAAIDASVPMIMVSHASCPNITGDDRPASFSPAVMTGLLRSDLGFRGVVITDALNMVAATKTYGETEAALHAFEAGADMLLMPVDYQSASQAILDAVKDGSITQERLDASVARILIMKFKYEKGTAALREAAAKAAEEEAAKKAEAEAKKAEEEAEQAEEEAKKTEETKASEGGTSTESETTSKASAASLNLSEDYRSSFVHGDKGAGYQKYIMLHDTESSSDAYSIINYWDSSGQGVAAHFIVNTDGSVVQCVPLDKITHHAGFGDAGHNTQYGVEDESRDDKVGTVPIGDWAPDYGMNSYSVGIEMVHVSGGAAYTEEQLSAVDALIAHIDEYYGFESAIIDHKAWRSGNSDTSPEFAGYLANYQDHRTHN